MLIVGIICFIVGEFCGVFVAALMAANRNMKDLVVEGEINDDKM